MLPSLFRAEPTRPKLTPAETRGVGPQGRRQGQGLLRMT